MTTRFVLLLH